MLLQTHAPCPNPRKRRLSFSSERLLLDKEIMSPLSVRCTSPDIFPDSPRSVLSFQEDTDTEEEPVSKVPRYVGTIYEQRLAPLSPVTSLPVPAVVGMTRPRPNSRLQDRLRALIEDGEVAALDDFLEENGKHVDVNQYDEDGVTPLQRLCQDGGQVAVARVLLKYGADLRLTSRDGWSPLHMATFSGNLKLLIFLRNCPK